jgi:ribonucleoside-diphosphate reductase alpha chain
VCCLSSLNLEYYDEWSKEPGFVEDCMRFLDNVLEDFIENAPDTMANARYSATQSRSVGLGVMGFHSLLQKKNIPWESVVTKTLNHQMFKYIFDKAQDASRVLAKERGACPDAKAMGVEERFSHKIAIAPTASISIICGGASPGIEPYVSNAYTHKTLSGSFPVRNRYLKKILQEKGYDQEDIWSDIVINEGSVQHLDFFSDYEKAIFKTGFEIDQRWLIQLASDRQPYVCQAQSLNLFIPADVHKKDLHEYHMRAWKENVKSLYYVRSLAIQRAEKRSVVVKNLAGAEKNEENLPLNYEECLACQ